MPRDSRGSGHLKADVSEAGEGWSDSRIIAALDTSASMVYRVRKQVVEEGFEAAARNHPRQSPIALIATTFAPLTKICKRGKSGGGMIIRFPRRRESDSLWACRRPMILTACRTPS